MSETTQPAAPAAVETIKVRVVQQAVTEGGKTYLKGQVLEVTAQRAEELGAFVKAVPVPPPAPVPPPVLVKVEVVGEPIEEGGVVHDVGSVLELTAERVAALGKFVQPVTTEAAK